MVFRFFTHVARNAVNIALNKQANLWYKSSEMWLYVMSDAWRYGRLVTSAAPARESHVSHNTSTYFGMGTWEIQIFRDRTPCRLFNSFLCFGGPCCFHLEGIPFLGRWGRNLPFRNVGSSRLDYTEDGGSKLPRSFGIYQSTRRHI